MNKPTEGIVVDGSCRPNPGLISWQGVDLATGKTVFRYGPIPVGTNNIAEFLAIVHALCISEGLVYSDSKCALSWIKAGRGKYESAQTPKVLDLMNRANAKLSEIRRAVWRVRHWDTKLHGENPADFGYKH